MVTEEEVTGSQKKTRRVGCAAILWILLAISFLAAGYTSRLRLQAAWQAFLHPGTGESVVSSATETAGERKILYWTCSMHPHYKSDKPGNCPECGMALTPVYEQDKQAAAGERKVLYWQDPMNPSRKSDRPGKAPDGMDLVPVYAEGGEAPKNLPDSAFQISAEKQQLIGIQYGEVQLQPLSKTLRATARLTYDETRITRVHPKIAGWIEKVFVNFTGDLVRKGQPLLSVYSPELVATQEEYLLALKARDRLGKSSIKEVAGGAESLLEAARRRLELWDMSDVQIGELEKTGKPIKAVTVYSTASGFVVARNAFERQRIMPETELYSLADLSTVWAVAEVYEYEAQFIHMGQGAGMTLASFPGRTFKGRVAYIYPQLESSTRTLRVRVEFQNSNFALKPDMYADVDLKIDYGKRLAVPREAVLDSGSEQIVFVALDGGFFEPRKVQLGDKVDNSVIVLEGLKAGERVVTSGNFLVDSESKLKSAIGGMSMPGVEPAGGRTSAPAEKPADSVAPRGGGMDHSKHQLQPEQNPHD